MLYIFLSNKPIHVRSLLLEEEEEAAADQLHLQALLDVVVEQPEQRGGVLER